MGIYTICFMRVSRREAPTGNSTARESGDTWSLIPEARSAGTLVLNEGASGTNNLIPKGSAAPLALAFVLFALSVLTNGATS